MEKEDLSKLVMEQAQLQTRILYANPLDKESLIKRKHEVEAKIQKLQASVDKKTEERRITWTETTTEERKSDIRGSTDPNLRGLGLGMTDLRNIAWQKPTSIKKFKATMRDGSVEEVNLLEIFTYYEWERAFKEPFTPTTKQLKSGYRDKHGREIPPTLISIMVV